MGENRSFSFREDNSSLIANGDPSTVSGSQVYFYKSNASAQGQKDKGLLPPPLSDHGTLHT